MIEFGFHASHEQHSPGELLRLAALAEQAGFNSAMCSDHFHPWSVRYGQSGYAWSWLGAALQRTSLSFGTVTAPGYRYHPAIVAQGASTLAQMFPGRFWLAIGSGEALNEAITGAPWPAKPERNARLKEAADVLRALWAGETVNHDGQVRVRGAKLYSRAEQPPLLLGAALSVETARWMAPWVDGLITAGTSSRDLRDLVDAFRTSGGEGKPLYLQAAVCHAPTRAAALAEAHDRWRQAALQPAQLADIATPEEFDEASRDVDPESLAETLRVSDSMAEIYDGMMRDGELGFDKIFVHHVGHRSEQFIEEFAEHAGLSAPAAESAAAT